MRWIEAEVFNVTGPQATHTLINGEGWQQRSGESHLTASAPGYHEDWIRPADLAGKVPATRHQWKNSPGRHPKAPSAPRSDDRPPVLCKCGKKATLKSGRCQRCNRESLYGTLERRKEPRGRRAA